MDVSYSADYSSNPVFWVIYAAVVLLAIIALWRVFAKAGRPGWAAIIPIYNIYTLVKVSGNSGWFTLLYFIPIVNVVIAIIVAIGVAKNFGKSGAFGFFGLFLFSLIGYLVLGFGKAPYVGASAAA
jgi:hypothetical protein